MLSSPPPTAGSTPVPSAASQPSAEAKGPFWKSGAFQLGVGIIISIVCLALAGRSLLSDAEARRQVVVAFTEANYALIPVIMGLLVIFFWLKAWRWQMLLSPLGKFETVRECFPPVMIGFAFNNVLPAHLGEFVRIFVFSRQHNLAKSSVFSTVALERVLDILAILLYLGAGLFLVEGVSPGSRSVAMTIGGLAIFGFFGALAFVIFTKPVVRLAEGILKRMSFIPEGLRTKIVALIEAGAAGLASLKNPWTLVGLMLTSIAQWGINGLVIHISLRCFGIDVPPQVSMIVMGVTAFGVTVPSAPGYFGVIQICFVEVLKQFPVSQPAVFAASIFYHMVQWIPVTLVGMIFFALSGVRLKEVEGAKQHGDPTEPTLSGTAPMPE